MLRAKFLRALDFEFYVCENQMIFAEQLGLSSFRTDLVAGHDSVDVTLSSIRECDSSDLKAIAEEFSLVKILVRVDP